MKRVMKRVVPAMCGLGLVVAVGVFPLAAPVEATSTKQIGQSIAIATVPEGEGPPTPTGTVVSFFLGEDGGVWYTSTRPVGAGVAPSYAPTGNPGNPFDSPLATGQGVGGGCVTPDPANCTGFVDPIGLAAACSATGDTCAGIYARIPGAGSFLDAPTVSDPGSDTHPSPLCATPNDTQITMTGLDNNFWYTRFDSGFDAGAPPVAWNVAACPERDPFFTATENLLGGPGTSTGFIATGGATGLGPVCASPLVGRTCIGVWVRFP